MNIPKIYVANLGKYNEGELVGKWIELPFTDDELNDLFVEIGLGQYNEKGEYVHGIENDGIYYEEWAIHDYENILFEVSEYSSLWEINEKIEEINFLDNEQKLIYEAYIDNINDDHDEAISAANNYNYFVCEARNKAMAAMEYNELQGHNEENNTLWNCIDWEKVAREMEFNSYVFVKLKNGETINDLPTYGIIFP